VHRRVTEGVARRSRVQRLNDNTLEYVIFGLRVLAGVSACGLLVAAVALVWTGDLRWLATLVLTIIWSGVFGWLGFWTFGNEGWRRGEPQ